MIHKTAETVGALKSTDKIPFNTRVQLRCLKEEFGNSKSSGNLMITRTFEIVGPETIEVEGGRKVEAIGTEITQYRVLRNYEDDKTTIDPKKSAKSVDTFLSERRALELPVPEELNDEEPPLDMEGLIVEATISCQERVSREPLTAEEKAAGKTLGKEIEINGKKVVTYTPQIVALLQKSTLQANAPY